MKKILIVLVILVLAAGGVLSLALFGMIKLPGIKPLKGKNVAAKPGKAQKKSLPVVSKSPAPSPPPAPPAAAPVTPPAAPPKKVAATTDPEGGAQALATIWNEMDAAKLTPILKSWKDADVARVFRNMEADKVAEVLGTLTPDRASKISDLMQKQASVVQTAS